MIHMHGQRLKHDPLPSDLGVTLDWTLSYREHLSQNTVKLNSRVIAKLTLVLHGVPSCDIFNLGFIIFGCQTH